MAGPQGAVGAAGPVGPQGAQGLIGPQGPAGLVLVGAQNWMPNAGGLAYFRNSYQALSGSGFPGITHGNPLLISLTVPLFEGGPGQAQVSCMPVVDGSWAGQFGMVPTLSPVESTKEGWIWMGSATPYMVWSSSRVYTGIPAGSHQFSVQCWANANNVVVPGPSASSISSLTVLELQ